MTATEILIRMIEQHGHRATALDNGKIAASSKFIEPDTLWAGWQTQEIPATRTAVRDWLGY